jgi:hypothetical protein
VNTHHAAVAVAARGSGSSEVIVETGTRVKRSDIDFDSFSDAKRRKTEKGGKGLRHFSMKVCEKVQAKGSTSYNEVADELVVILILNLVQEVYVGIKTNPLKSFIVKQNL